MKKKTILSALLLCLAATLHAQTPGNIIYLKNGSIIKGNVVESVPNQHIKIRTSDGSIFVYQMSDVDRIVLNEEKKETTPSEGPKSWQQKGHRGLDFSISLGPDVTFNNGKGSARFGTEIEGGKKFNKNFYFGVGLGVSAGNGNTSIPLFGSLRTFFPVDNSRVTPTLLFQGGYSFITGDGGGSGRIVLMPGLQLPVNNKVDFNCGMGYLGYFGNGASSHGFGIRVGFGFHKPTDGIFTPAPTRDNGLEYAFDLTLKSPWDENRIGLTGDLLIGYKMNPNLSFGVGYSLGQIEAPYSTYEEEATNADQSDAHPTYSKETTSEYLMQHSLFVRGKYRLNDNKFSPFASVDVGWHFFKWNENAGQYGLQNGWGLDKDKLRKVGLFLTPAVGGSLRVAPNSYLEFKIGYEIATKAIGNTETEWVKSGRYNSYYRRTVQKGKTPLGHDFQRRLCTHPEIPEQIKAFALKSRQDFPFDMNAAILPLLFVKTIRHILLHAFRNTAAPSFRYKQVCSRYEKTRWLVKQITSHLVWFSSRFSLKKVPPIRPWCQRRP